MPCRTSRKKKRRRSENERKKIFFLFLFLSLIILPALVEFRRRSLQNMKWKKNRKIEKPCWFNICSLFNQKKISFFIIFHLKLHFCYFLHTSERVKESFLFQYHRPIEIESLSRIILSGETVVKFQPTRYVLFFLLPPLSHSFHGFPFFVESLNSTISIKSTRQIAHRHVLQISYSQLFAAFY